jgi:hypothetical protein
VDRLRNKTIPLSLAGRGFFKIYYFQHISIAVIAFVLNYIFRHFNYFMFAFISTAIIALFHLLFTLPKSILRPTLRLVYSVGSMAQAQDHTLSNLSPFIKINSFLGVPLPLPSLSSRISPLLSISFKILSNLSAV